MADETDNETPQDAEVEAQASDEAQPSRSRPRPRRGRREPATGSAPPEQLSSKERRRRARSTHGARHVRRAPPRSVTPNGSPSVAAKAVKRRARRLQERAKAAERRAGAPAREPLPPVHAAGRGCPQGSPGSGRLRQGRQDDHRAHRRRSSPPALREDRAQLEHAARPRREQRGHTRETWCESSRVVRCRAPSAGSSWMCWRRRDDPKRDQASCGRQHRRARDPLHSRQGWIQATLRVRGRRHHGDREAG